jgi:hypothetical protein
MVDHFSIMLTQKRLQQYIQGDKKTKAAILKDYCQLTGVTNDTARQRFHRSMLKMFWPRVLSLPNRKKRGRLKKYRPSHIALIGKLREISGEVCAERLHPMIVDYLKQLDNHHYLSIFLPEVVSEIKTIPLGSLKRTMKGFVSVNNKKSRKGNSAIFKQVPIDANFGRFTKTPGYMEVDYVEHGGGDGSGRFAITGTYVDLFSQWTVRAAALGKSLD